MPRFNRGRSESENGERAGIERRGEGKEKVEGMTEGRGWRKAWAIRMGGIAPLLLGGIDATAAPQVLACTCSGVARHFLAVRAYAVWRPNRGDSEFTFR